MTKKGGIVEVSLLPLKGAGGFFNKEVRICLLCRGSGPFGAERLGHI